MEAVPQPGKGMFQKTSSALIRRRIQLASVLNEGMSQSDTQTTGTNLVNVQSGLSLHARRTRQRTPLRSAKSQKGRFNEARAPHSPPPIFKYLFLPTEDVFNYNRLFCLFILPTRVAVRIRWFVIHTHTYELMFFCGSPTSGFLTSTSRSHDSSLRTGIICQIDPPFRRLFFLFSVEPLSSSLVTVVVRSVVVDSHIQL